MPRLRTTILLGSLFASLISQSANAGLVMRDRNTNCHIVGMILNLKDSKVQTVLCENDQLNVQSRVLVSCRYKSMTEWLSVGTHEINRFCPSGVEPRRECFSNKQGCFRSRTKLYLVGQTFAFKDVSPHLKWSPIDNADRYSLLIQSSDGKEVYREWVTSSEYQFPYALRPGELYEIDIGLTGGKVSDKFAIHILSQEHIAEMNSMIEIINLGNWTEIEKVLYRDGVYTRFGLVLEAIENLEQSPELKESRELQARLGNVYIAAGYLEKARKIFEMLDQVTFGRDNDFQSQLPTSTKLPQE